MFQTPAGIGISTAFRHMDMHTHPQSGGEIGGGGQRLIGTGECRMDANHAPAARSDETLALGQTPPRRIGHMGGSRAERARLPLHGNGPEAGVSIRNTIGTYNPDTYFGARVGDDIETALDGIGTFMMINDGGGTAFKGFQSPEFGRPLQHLQVEGTVEPPPHLLQDGGKVWRGPGRRGHATGQGRIEVMMCADKPGRGGSHTSHTMGLRQMC